MCFTINKNLYQKYSQSQNYYYIKEINEILTNKRTISVIKYKNIKCYDEEKEFFKR